MLEHPEIGWIERTGYPSCMQVTCDDIDDRAYEEAKERELFGNCNG
ncbi:MAG: hypothetical protein J6V25_01740 [Oscillospiraceae bacterium]|nr:hypothetical protein [Oscillospiraceae bacterium]